MSLELMHQQRRDDKADSEMTIDQWKEEHWEMQWKTNQ